MERKEREEEEKERKRCFHETLVCVFLFQSKLSALTGLKDSYEGDVCLEFSVAMLLELALTKGCIL